MKTQGTQIIQEPEPIKAVLISQTDLESVLAKLTAETTKKWLTLKEAASYLRISEISLRNFIRYKKISHYKIEGKLLFKITELDKFIEQNKIESISDLVQKSVNGRK
ncbi:MAG: helix-turn-helix domain-containing protein [Deltaproteobacteria bacterium]|nr:helix-turn-helix domain-containing protein [Deltaproteobacteria bacterium]